MDNNQIESNIIILSNRARLKLFCKIYKKTILFFAFPLAFSPIAFIGDNDAYISFYIFLITASYWIFDILHPAVTSLIPVALSTFMNYLDHEIINFIYIRNVLLDCFGILMFIAAIEDSKIHKRLAVKILYIFGCSHYRLCFLIFFTTMLLSMWISNTIACGFMMPIVKAIIIELEKMGILELYETISKSNNHEERDKIDKRPTDFTVFYFLGVAYSSSIGGMATMTGSQTNEIFKVYSEKSFPLGPKIEFPQFMLLTLPGVLVLETMLYLWMNFYFLGLFRIHNYSTLQTGSTEEESQYVKTLLKIQYEKLGSITMKETVVCITIIICILLQMSTSTYLCRYCNDSHIQVSSPTILCVLILFLTPTNMDFLKFCKKRNGQRIETMPSTPSKPCLSWKIVKNEIHWSILFVIGGSCVMFDALKQARMTDEFEKLLQVFSDWPAAILVLMVVVFCKILTEFASNTCVAHCLLDHVIRVSLTSQVNPHYLMLAATLSCSLPFHLITGTPANAMVASYFNIPRQKMIYAGIGPTLFSIVVIWFTVTIWSKAIWTDITLFPDWAINNNLTNN
ncbi:protein I'm not dead yet-like [Epargyreus clarus]|uniref:protein I'm not dead yet-like n=1 Tax=Epargyreus clarus TaxID=520877 RepID=UPI003C2F1EFE